MCTICRPVTTVDDLPVDLSLRGVDTKHLQSPPSLLSVSSFLPKTPGDVASAVFDDVIQQAPSHAANCRMDNCFDFSRCRNGYKVYIYPLPDYPSPSEAYQQIINVIKSSQFYTDDADEACIYISSLDTLDRDHLSADYVHNLQAQLTSLPHWNDGRNHVIFNLYSGTWPDYSENFGMDIGYAMLAKASVSTHKFRAGFDISLPLFHKTLPERGGEESRLMNVNVPSSRKYLLSFKGKRYLTGIGSVSRNALHHIHNGEDIILLTTCKHGDFWEKYADERCAEDNNLFDK